MNEKLHIKGAAAVEDLCKISEELGYRGWFQKLTLRNGASVTSLLNLLEGNPDLVKVIYSWIEKKHLVTLDYEEGV
jgi:hypothetical protein